VALVAGLLVYPPALILLFLGAVVYVISSMAGSRMRALMPPFRQLGPLIAAAAALASFADGNTAAIAGTLPEDARRLAPLRRIVGWISRDSVNVGDMRGLAIEYLNMFLFLDRTALYFAAREITARRRELQVPSRPSATSTRPSRSRPIAPARRAGRGRRSSRRTRPRS